MNVFDNLTEEQRKEAYSLLISKLPEKRKHNCNKSVCAEKDNKDGFNSAIDDVHKIFDEMFEVKE